MSDRVCTEHATTDLQHVHVRGDGIRWSMQSWKRNGAVAAATANDHRTPSEVRSAMHATDLSTFPHRRAGGWMTFQWSTAAHNETNDSYCCGQCRAGRSKRPHEHTSAVNPESLLPDRDMRRQRATIKKITTQPMAMQLAKNEHICTHNIAVITAHWHAQVASHLRTCPLKFAPHEVTTLTCKKKLNVVRAASSTCTMNGFIWVKPTQRELQPYRELEPART